MDRPRRLSNMAAFRTLGACIKRKKVTVFARVADSPAGTLYVGEPQLEISATNFVEFGAVLGAIARRLMDLEEAVSQVCIDYTLWSRWSCGILCVI